MGANAQTSVPLFVANSVLTAAQQNISAATGVPVFATTVTRDAAFGGSNKVLAEGQLCYLESTDVVQQYNGTSWITVGPAAASGLTLVSATTIGSAVASVTVSSAFSATYDAYKITITGGTPSTSCDISMTLGASATGYYSMASLVAYSGGATTTFGVNNGSNWARAGGGLSGQLLTFDVNLFNPFLAQYSYFTNGIVFLANAGPGGGYHGVATSFSAFTLTPSAGTLTGGIIRVYGYQNS